MDDTLANANVNRTSTLAAMSIAIFTFTLIFLFPKFAAGDIDSTIFQAALAVIAVAIFAFVLAGAYYYASTQTKWLAERERATFFKRGDVAWLAGQSLLLLDPSLVLFSVRLFPVALVWLVLWLSYVGFSLRWFRRYMRQSRPGEASSTLQ
jgi:hypothetical protein